MCPQFFKSALQLEVYCIHASAADVHFAEGVEWNACSDTVIPSDLVLTLKSD